VPAGCDLLHAGKPAFAGPMRINSKGELSLALLFMCLVLFMCLCSVCFPIPCGPYQLCRQFGE
jgi:hypothetical protein